MSPGISEPFTEWWHRWFSVQRCVQKVSVTESFHAALRSTFGKQKASFCLWHLLYSAHLWHTFGVRSQLLVTICSSDFSLCRGFFNCLYFLNSQNLFPFTIPCTLHRNIASQTVARLKDVARRILSRQDLEQHSRDSSASLDLLLRFQRLLISKLYPGESPGQTSESCSKLPIVFTCPVCVLGFLVRLTCFSACSGGQFLYCINASNSGGFILHPCVFGDEYFYIRLTILTF